MKRFWLKQFDGDNSRRRQGASGKQRRTGQLLESGDRVRITKKRFQFHRGFKQQWSSEIFVVERKINRKPPVYRLIDADGESILGTFYAPELQKVRINI